MEDHRSEDETQLLKAWLLKATYGNGSGDTRSGCEGQTAVLDMNHEGGGPMQPAPSLSQDFIVVVCVVVVQS